MTRTAPIYRQRRGLDTRLVDGEAFVITRTTIQHLNAVAALIWSLIGAGATHRAIVDALASAYPDVPRPQLSRDARNTIRLLVQLHIVKSTKTGS